MFRYKGRKIRYGDKNLVFKFWFCSLFFIFISVMFLFHFNWLFNYDWSHFSFLRLSEFWNNLDKLYLMLSVGISVLVCMCALILLKVFCRKYLLKLCHRQEIARMIVENKWYEGDTYHDGFWGNSQGRKERIVYFPKVYYKMKDNRIYVTVKISMGKAQDYLLTLNKKIETGLFCEFIEFKTKEPYYEYVFYYDMKGTRLSVGDIKAANESIELMKGFVWKFDKLPHALIVGGTGSGKTYFILILIYALIKLNADIIIFDPKNADLADLSVVMPNVFHSVSDIVMSVEKFASDMLDCSERMKLMSNYKTGCNYADLGLKPHFLIFDEYVAFFEMLSTKEVNAVLSSLKRIVMLGRQAGYFLILACQRADARYLGDGIRDQFHFRVALGRNSEMGYKMIFGETDKKFMTMPSGCGYIDMGTNIISEFYVPYVPDDFDFIKEIGQYFSKKSWLDTSSEVLEPLNEEME